MFVLRVVQAIWYFPTDIVRHLINESHRSHRSSYMLMRKSYSLTKGRSRRLFRRLFGICRPNRNAQSLDDRDRDVLGRLRANGIATISGYLPDERVEAIKTFLAGQEHQRVSTTKNQYSADVLLGSPEIAALVHDPFFLRLAGAYLGSVPIFVGVAGWWSLADPHATQEELSKAAQLYHYDYDWPAFVKFFVYLTDVGDDNGPFTFVEGTHEKKQRWRDGRVDDKEIEAAYSGRQRRMTGKAGDLVIADTAGYHKGERVTGQPRLILQFEYAVSRLGASGQYELLPRAMRPPGEGRTFDVFAR